MYLEVGIVTGCTISVIIFSAAINLLVKTAEKMSRGPITISGIRQPPTKAFMDDMTITAKSGPEGRWMLEDLERLIFLVKNEVQAYKVKKPGSEERDSSGTFSLQN